MKKRGLLFTLPLLLTAMAACDNIDEKDRYIEVENRPLARKVLLEEFTGQDCVNCPAAHAVIEKLEEQFEGNLIVVSIHAGNFGRPASEGGLMQEEGDVYAKKWGVTAYPSGVVDENSGVLNFDGWSTAIRKDGYYPSDMELDMNAYLSSDGKTINVECDLTSDVSASGHLQLWVVEDGIIGFQRDGNNRIYDYVHNNVFRGCVNGVWGQEITISRGESQNFYNTTEMHTVQPEEIDNWNPDNLYIVGFVYNDSGVLVVNRCKIS